MTAEGWTGRPVIAFDDPAYGLMALTGSHRIAAARKAGIAVQVLVLSDLDDDEIVALRSADCRDGAVADLRAIDAPAEVIEVAKQER